jgi:septum formation protein
VKLVLASRSPQRRALLTQLAIPFRVEVSRHEEDTHHGRPGHTVESNARGKAEEVLGRITLAGDELVLGVDTVVVIDGLVLGKAADEQEATAYLQRLAGRRHEVHSGLHLCAAHQAVTLHAVTAVTFRPLDAVAIARYVRCGEWRERAGAYAIQGIGSALVEHVDGDYFNVVGLPVAALLEALSAFAAPPFSWLQKEETGNGNS